MNIIFLLIEFTTISLAAFIAGSTAYISIVEVPARGAMSPSTSAGSWLKVFPRAAKTMKTSGFILMPLLIVSFLLTWNWLWIGALIPFFILGPYTGKRMAPINNALQDPSLDITSDKAHELTTEWGARHLIRTYLACFGFAIALLAGLV